MKSPLLFPVTMRGNTIFVLDETQLPFKKEHIEVSTFEGAITVLKEMKTRSLGQVLLFFYSCAVFHDTHKIDEVAEKFKEVRPTFDFDTMARVLKQQIGNSINIKDVATSFIDMFDAARRQRAKKLAHMLPEAARVLTLCNVNGELIYLYEEMAKLNKKCRFYILETRPYLQGTRLTFWELNQNNIPAKIVCDNQAAQLMRSGVINCVVTGADRATFTGDIINKIGTYAVARLAKHFQIPFYPLTQYPRNVDIDSIEIEERPPEETFMFLGGAFSNTDAVYPAFDITKKDYITKTVELQI
jgi:methylthioribose-1-phosphate isomerase